MQLLLFLALDTPLNTSQLNEVTIDLEPVVVYERNIDLGSHTGFLPAVLGNTTTGVETYKIDYAELGKQLPPNSKIDPKKVIVIQFRWGGDFHEGAIALYTAALYSATYNGIAFDPMSGTYLTTKQLKEGFMAFISELD